MSELFDLGWRGILQKLVGFWGSVVRPATQWLTQVVVWPLERLFRWTIDIPVPVRDYISVGLILLLSAGRTVVRVAPKDDEEDVRIPRTTLRDIRDLIIKDWRFVLGMAGICLVFAGLWPAVVSMLIFMIFLEFISRSMPVEDGALPEDTRTDETYYFEIPMILPFAYLLILVGAIIFSSDKSADRGTVADGWALAPLRAAISSRCCPIGEPLSDKVIWNPGPRDKCALTPMSVRSIARLSCTTWNWQGVAAGYR